MRIPKRNCNKTKVQYMTAITQNMVQENYRNKDTNLAYNLTAV
jgi:hypothetical protein